MSGKMENNNSTKTIHVFGINNLYDELTSQLVTSLIGKNLYFESIESYSYFLPQPNIIFIDCQLNHASKCLEFRLELEHQFSKPHPISTRYVAITSTISYSDYIKASKLIQLCVINLNNSYLKFKNQLDDFLV